MTGVLSAKAKLKVAKVFKVVEVATNNKFTSQQINQYTTHDVIQQFFPEFLTF